MLPVTTAAMGARGWDPDDERSEADRYDEECGRSAHTDSLPLRADADSPHGDGRAIR